MPVHPPITDAESLVMEVLWAGAPRSAEYQGRRYLYSPVLQRADWVDAQSRSVLDRLFGGRVAPLVAHFSARHELSREDLAELRKLIDGLDDGQAR